MTDLFEQSSQKLDAAITEIQHAIATGLANKQRLFETMRQLYGEGSANGAWSQRDAFDLLEAALTRHMAGLLSKPQMLTQISEISARLAVNRAAFKTNPQTINRWIDRFKEVSDGIENK